MWQALVLSFLLFQCSSAESGNGWNDPIKSYTSAAQMAQMFRTLEHTYPHLVQVGSVGKSVLHKDIPYIRISSLNGSPQTLEPKFKFVANMHGDETVGRQLLLKLSLHLTKMYNRDQRITDLVDNTIIYLVPTMNPDGFAVSGQSEGKKSLIASLYSMFREPSTGRYNHHGVDLNRNFPSRLKDQEMMATKDIHQLTDGREKETAAMIRFIMGHKFALSANMHGGALVASYPFDDYVERHDGTWKSPDDALFKFLATLYSEDHPRMRSGDACKHDTFTDGITNGARWYKLVGGMQDFSYLVGETPEITLELSCIKRPNENTLEKHWNENKESMLKYIEASHLGIKGRVMTPDGCPVEGAKIYVKGIDHEVTTDSQGRYWRVIAPGTYRFRAESLHGDLKSAEKVVEVKNNVKDGGPISAIEVNFVLSGADFNDRRNIFNNEGRRC